MNRICQFSACLLILVSIWTENMYVSGQCSPPASYLNTGWFQSYVTDPTQSDWIYALYSQSSITTTNQKNSTMQKLVYNCLSSYTQGSFYYYLYENMIIGRVCAKSSINAGLSTLFIVERETTSLTSATDCAAYITPSCFTTGSTSTYSCSSVFRPKATPNGPPVFTKVQCPFQGSYQLTVTYVQQECAGDSSSKAVVSGQTIQLNACAGYAKNSTYKQNQILSDTLTCLGDMDGSAITTEEGQAGERLVLLTSSDLKTLYCAKYTVVGATILISIDVSVRTMGNCGTFNSTSAQQDNFLALKLSSDSSTTSQSTMVGSVGTATQAAGATTKASGSNTQGAGVTTPASLNSTQSVAATTKASGNNSESTNGNGTPGAVTTHAGGANTGTGNGSQAAATATTAGAGTSAAGGQQTTAAAGVTTGVTTAAGAGVTTAGGAGVTTAAGAGVTTAGGAGVTTAAGAGATTAAAGGMTTAAARVTTAGNAQTTAAAPVTTAAVAANSTVAGAATTAGNAQTTAAAQQTTAAGGQQTTARVTITTASPVQVSTLPGNQNTGGASITESGGGVTSSKAITTSAQSATTKINPCAAMTCPVTYQCFVDGSGKGYCACEPGKVPSGNSTSGNATCEMAASNASKAGNVIIGLAIAFLAAAALAVVFYLCLSSPKGALYSGPAASRVVLKPRIIQEVTPEIVEPVEYVSAPPRTTTFLDTNPQYVYRIQPPTFPSRTNLYGPGLYSNGGYSGLGNQLVQLGEPGYRSSSYVLASNAMLK